MTHLIDKDAIVEEIEKRIKSINSCPFRTAELGSEKLNEGQLNAYNLMLSFIDTYEDKEVDLDEAARKWEDKVYLEKGWQDEYGTPHAPFSEIGNAFREGAKFILKTQKGYMV